MLDSNAMNTLILQSNRNAIEPINLDDDNQVMSIDSKLVLSVRHDPFGNTIRRELSSLGYTSINVAITIKSYNSNIVYDHPSKINLSFDGIGQWVFSINDLIPHLTHGVKYKMVLKQYSNSNLDWEPSTLDNPELGMVGISEFTAEDYRFNKTVMDYGFELSYDDEGVHCYKWYDSNGIYKYKTQVFMEDGIITHKGDLVDYNHIF